MGFNSGFKGLIALKLSRVISFHVAVSKMYRRYKDEPICTEHGKNRGLLCNSYGSHKYILCEKFRFLYEFKWYLLLQLRFKYLNHKVTKFDVYLFVHKRFFFLHSALPCQSL